MVDLYKEVNKKMKKTRLAVIGGLIGLAVLTAHVGLLAFEEGGPYLPLTAGVALGVLYVIVGLVYALIKG